MALFSPEPLRVVRSRISRLRSLYPEVIAAPIPSNLSAGDLIVGIVRRPDPVPCSNCAIGELDMCRNGVYTERCIKDAHGYGAEFFTSPIDFTLF